MPASHTRILIQDRLMAYAAKQESTRDSWIKRKGRSEKTWMTVLTSVATVLGAVALLVVFVGLAGISVGFLSEGAAVWGRQFESEGMYWLYFPLTDEVVRDSTREVGRVQLPSRACIALWFLVPGMTLPSIVRRGFTWQVVITLALVGSACCLFLVTVISLELGWVPSFIW
jgi:hypothetical protein